MTSPARTLLHPRPPRVFAPDDIRTIVIRRNASGAEWSTIALDWGVSAETIEKIYNTEMRLMSSNDEKSRSTTSKNVTR